MSVQKAEAIMNTFWDFRLEGHFSESIEQVKSFGYNPEIVDYVFDSTSYHLPELVASIVKRTEAADSSKIPVVALHPGIDYINTPSNLHPYQKIALTSLGFSDNSIHETNAAFANALDRKLSTAGNGVGAASTYAMLMESERNADDVIQSRPTLVLNVDDHPIDPAEYTSVVLHELVHVTQALDSPTRPLMDKKHAMKKELEAYAVQSKLVGNFVIPYSLSTAMAGEVERFRKNTLGNDGYDPDDYFMKSAEQDSVLYKVINSLQ